MVSVTYDVDLISEESAQMSWAGACAMGRSFGSKTGVSILDLVNELDEGEFSVDDLSGKWSDCMGYVAKWGFTVGALADLAGGDVTAESLTTLLKDKGPLVLFHLCTGFPYGEQWADEEFLDNEANAVLITGADTDANTATFNNSWGDKDQSCDLDGLVGKINSDQKQGKTLAIWPPVQSDASTGGAAQDDPNAPGATGAAAVEGASAPTGEAANPVAQDAQADPGGSAVPPPQDGSANPN